MQTHFRRINGTSLANFEGHLAEIMWRNRVGRHEPVPAMLRLMADIYDVHSGIRRTDIPHPLFPTWRNLSKVKGLYY